MARAWPALFVFTVFTNIVFDLYDIIPAERLIHLWLFTLRLRDGSEYLLSASSRFMMKKWILRIQANAGNPL